MTLKKKIAQQRTRFLRLFNGQSSEPSSILVNVKKAPPAALIAAPVIATPAAPVKAPLAAPPITPAIRPAEEAKTTSAAAVALALANRELSVEKAKTTSLQAKIASQPKRPGVELALKQARLGLAPAALHVSEGLGSLFHIDLWISHLREALGTDVFVILRSAPLFDSLKDRNDIDCVYVREGRDAEVLMHQCPAMKAVFYVSNTGNVIHFVRLNHLRHVFLGHGDSEKSASCHRFFRVYDEVWTAGKAHIDRFIKSGLRFESIDFKVIGRPGLREVLTAPTEISGTRFLYLPTWEGYQNSQNYSSLPLGQEILTVAANGGRLPVVKFHPWTGKQIDAAHYKEHSLRDAFKGRGLPLEIKPRNESIAAVIADTDFLISDISSVISDYLITLRPIFVYIPTKTRVELATSHMSYTNYVYTFTTAEELDRLIDRVIVQGHDELAENRVAALDYFVDIHATREGRFLDECRRICAAAPSTDASMVADGVIQRATVSPSLVS